MRRHRRYKLVNPRGTPCISTLYNIVLRKHYIRAYTEYGILRSLREENGSSGGRAGVTGTTKGRGRSASHVYGSAAAACGSA